MPALRTRREPALQQTLDWLSACAALVSNDIGPAVSSYELSRLIHYGGTSGCLEDSGANSFALRGKMTSFYASLHFAVTNIENALKLHLVATGLGIAKGSSL